MPILRARKTIIYIKQINTVDGIFLLFILRVKATIPEDLQLYCAFSTDMTKYSVKEGPYHRQQGQN